MATLWPRTGQSDGNLRLFERCAAGICPGGFFLHEVFQGGSDLMHEHLILDKPIHFLF